MIKLSVLLMTCSTVIGLSLLNETIVTGIYEKTGGSFGLAPSWIQSHSWQISNYGHMLAYGLLILLLDFSVTIKPLTNGALVFTLACSLEALQVLVPGRRGSLIDIGYDIGGIIPACILLTVLSRKKNRAARPKAI